MMLNLLSMLQALKNPKSGTSGHALAGDGCADERNAGERSAAGLQSHASRVGFWVGLGFMLLVVALAAHWPARRGYFVVDDFLWLHIANWRSVADSFVGSQGAHVAYRPIFRVSTYIDASLFGREPLP